MNAAVLRNKCNLPQSISRTRSQRGTCTQTLIPKVPNPDYFPYSFTPKLHEYNSNPSPFHISHTTQRQQLSPPFTRQHGIFYITGSYIRGDPRPLSRGGMDDSKLLPVLQGSREGGSNNGRGRGCRVAEGLRDSGG
ncbi:hypothetical protein CDAR_8361 [Caerostris darwini]|uniref:Uncharacterized protein n=1 Tax=Caerostris darwini TaxID=1538125 RepID=A0AAV4WVI8_9ARAC|nr:hypothetical protein CDAR_8361 [Caerostris darwini]